MEQIPIKKTQSFNSFYAVQNIVNNFFKNSSFYKCILRLIQTSEVQNILKECFKNASFVNAV